MKSWVWYQSYGGKTPSLHTGSNSLTPATPVVVVAKQAAFGFNRVPLGECAWTAKDLA